MGCININFVRTIFFKCNISLEVNHRGKKINTRGTKGFNIKNNLEGEKRNLVGVSDLVQWTKLQLTMPTPHIIALVQVPAALLQIQLPISKPGKSPRLGRQPKDLGPLQSLWEM